MNCATRSGCLAAKRALVGGGKAAGWGRTVRPGGFIFRPPRPFLNILSLFSPVVFGFDFEKARGDGQLLAFEWPTWADRSEMIGNEANL